MRAIRFETSGRAHVVDVDVPRPGPGEVVVRVTSTGVCGSDLAALRGRHPFRIPPLISGHEAGGVVDSIGEGVVGTSVGERVVIDPQRPCGSCDLCDSGRYHLCPRKVMLGVAEWDGSFAELVAVPEHTLVPAPDEVRDEHLALAEPVAVAVHAVRQLGERSARRALVLGGGTIGALLCLVLRDRGSERVEVVEPREHVHPLLRHLGAEQVHAPGADLEPGGYEAVLVAAGVPDLLDVAMDAVAPGGAVVQVAVFDAPVPVAVGRLQVREVALLGTAMYTRADFEVALRLLREHPDLGDRLVTRTTGLEEGADLVTEMGRSGPGELVKLVMVP
ncbi:zinc-binding dehydrogenase [uncultured Pseudokineococcus sp.]|uniref:zinc-dependent alcohol dehydrogenase n=1 Tax=uncultured Pseudokineococcus sp. TaxID=1642928 RepID=UPI00262D00CF|nr:alcohol dehydrogenase catalytic domain-containing protein [uncultured Pseudokineococcus sp.]